MQPIPRDGRNETEQFNGVFVLLHQLKKLARVSQKQTGPNRDVPSAGAGNQAEALRADQAMQAQGAPDPVARPWGSFAVLDAGTRFKVKRIVVRPGEKLSLQMHYHRAEHWIVVSGTAEVIIADRTLLVHENESIGIPKSTFHRLVNPGKVLLQIIEVQSGEYLEEDDIVREEDAYGRTSAESSRK